ncbi:MAG: carboxypeptidase-like regulatory domain-containing protein [Planctomycetota bacterium]|nr:carboxypeptidase-like regulatory domain-containing protein [Planctomycetota bacterium]
MSQSESSGCFVRVNGPEFVKTVFSRLANAAFAVGLTLSNASSLCAMLDDGSKVTDPHLVKFLNAQGQEIELPEDFMVRVDGNKMEVALVAMGAINAQVPKSSLLVRLLNSSGNEKEATTDLRGIATFTDVQPDELHALLVVDEKVHAAVPLLTVSTENAIQRNISSKPVSLPLALVNREEILGSLARGVVPTNDPGGKLYDTSEYKLQSVNPYSVRLRNDGSLLGKIVIADKELAESLRYAKLTFLKDSQVVARTDSNPSDGSFNVAGLKPGPYSVIAAGPAGYASYAFDVLPVEKQARMGEAISGRPVSLVQADTNEKLFVFLCPPKLVPQITDRIWQAYGQSNVASSSASPVQGLPMAGNGGVGVGSLGGGGFGGGGFGGGGIGGAGLGIAGLAAVTAVVASNDNNTSSNVVSPIAKEQSPK